MTGTKPRTMVGPPMFTTWVDPAMAQKKAAHLLLVGPDLATVIVRERIGVRIVSCAGSGTHTAVDSPARSWPASAVASRRFVFTRVTCLAWDQRGRHDRARKAEFRD